MRLIVAALTLALAAMSESSCAFVAPTGTTCSKSLKMSPFSTPLPPSGTVHHRATTAPSTTTRVFNLSHTSNTNDIENEEAGGNSIAPSPRHSRMGTVRTFGKLLTERMDTLEAAGFYESDDDDASSSSGLLSDKDARGLVPMQAGVVRTGIQIAIAYWIFRKIKKMIGSRSKGAEDEGVVTTKEQDDALNAWTCSKCGATLFVARGKEFRYFAKNYKCYVCGNTGRENFTNTRDDIIEHVGDDFEMEQIWGNLSKKDQRRLLKEAFGDEDIAKKLAIDEANKAAGIDVTAASAEDIAHIAGEGQAAAETAEAVEATSDDADDDNADVDADATETTADDIEADSQEETSEPAAAPVPTTSAPAPSPAPKPAPEPTPAPSKPNVIGDDLDIFDELDAL